MAKHPLRKHAIPQASMAPGVAAMPLGVSLAYAALWLIAVLAGALPAPARAAEVRTIRVGPTRDVRTIAEAARIVRDDDSVEVDAGTYRGDVAVWTRRNLSLRAVGGRVRLVADGAAAEGKAIWVIRGDGVSVQGFDFEGARVEGRNGAGIRFESGSLRVRDCRFIRNQSGILTGNDRNSTLDVEDSEFADLIQEDGQNHLLYAGTIERLSVTGSYFHHGAMGHLLKSRAALNLIRYNRLTDEDGSASYEMEFPNGGVAHVIGNIVEQSAQTENPQIVSYGAEGYRWPRNALYLVNNTLVDGLPAGGVFLKVHPGAGPVRLLNNLLVGPGVLDAGTAEESADFHVPPGVFADASRHDYRLEPGAAALIGKAVDPGLADAQPLRPTREYSHPRATRLPQTPGLRPGAMQSVAPAR